MNKKQKLTKYYDMFTNEVIEVVNRRISEVAFYRRKTEQMKLKSMNKEEKEIYLREKAATTECECHHYTNTGICTYRNCRHKESDHPHNQWSAPEQSLY